MARTKKNKKKLHTEELNNLYTSQHIRMRKSTRIRLARYIAGMGEMKCIRNSAGKPERKIIFRDLYVDECKTDIIIVFLNIINRPDFLFKMQRFGDWILYPS
jgi:hypothetical protein